MYLNSGEDYVTKPVGLFFVTSFAKQLSLGTHYGSVVSLDSVNVVLLDIQVPTQRVPHFVCDAPGRP